MTKRVAAWGAVAAAILLGSVFRVFPSGESGPVRGDYRKPVLLFEGDSGIPSRPFALSGDAEGQDPSATEAAGEDSAGPSVPSAKKPPAKGTDPGFLERGVTPRKGTPGDMQDYLDKAERERRERVRKSLEEIRRKVRDWEPNVFEPTW